MINEDNLKVNTPYMKKEDGEVYEVEADIWATVSNPILKTQSGEVLKRLVAWGMGRW